MKKVAVFGSGMVARPAIQTLLETGHGVVVATDQPEVGEKLLGGSPHGQVRGVDATNAADVRSVVAECDLAISLLPVAFHVRVAEACVAERKSFVTTSYVSEEMQGLHETAKRREVLLLNEIGADPGIDHMQAMRLLDGLRAEGARITGFRSLCGGIPAPEANDNPFGYKLSWSPRGVVLAGMRPARFIDHGAIQHVEAVDIFRNPRPIAVQELGELESYPNGDSVRFESEYGLEDPQTFIRGSLRWPGWCDTWACLSSLGWIDDAPDAALDDTTFGAEMLRATAGRPDETPRAAAARALRRPESDAVLDRLEWLGLFSTDPVPANARSRADLLVDRMGARMKYADGERDMLVLHHEIDFEDAAGQPGVLIAQTMEYGVPGGDSAMSRTVGIPAGFAARRILDGTIQRSGVRIPITPDMYNPLLADLASVGIEETVIRR
ncbi:MAG: saccharopine dehydrogenase [Gemmatimonadetes bacterium]|nr:saccharopine dehydrogenase [Gemmatimonadota bacterium]